MITLYTEPKWKSYIVTSAGPLFSPEECKRIIKMGHSVPPKVAEVGLGKKESGVDVKKRTTTISWLPFEMQEAGGMYHRVNTFIKKANGNHFGFDEVHITENAQFTEYPTGGFYEWHMDSDVHMEKEPPVRKISMTILLNNPSEFEGGDLEIMGPGKSPKLTQGQAVIFASFLNHRVTPITRGMRQSLVMWFGGTPLR